MRLPPNIFELFKAYSTNGVRGCGGRPLYLKIRRTGLRIFSITRARLTEPGELEVPAQAVLAQALNARLTEPGELEGVLNNHSKSVHRVGVQALHYDREVKVGSGGQPGAAHTGKWLPLIDRLAFLYKNL